MKTLIIYRSHHGCSEKAARQLSESLNGETIVADMKGNPAHNLDGYDTIIIGGSIHAGQVQSVIKKFCKQNEKILLNKRLGLYLCCMEEGEKAQKQFESAFPESLRQHAIATGLFGGEFNFERMNFLEKIIIKKIGKVTQSISKLDIQAISQFASKIQH